eukprot:TRINITY_DN4203_c0_g1_i1.p1 TRINITY_DN4203_c0_g1~~TRINITY_DN4203_c0_g1_i1.p1  ORF type:complete len:323 (+),score=72.45 TRINITY_DN4203_c0_g1_i1:8-976(+)
MHLFDSRPVKVKLVDLFGGLFAKPPDDEKDHPNWIARLQALLERAEREEASEHFTDIKVPLGDYTNDFRVFRPRPGGPAGGPEARPLLIWIHGGGFCMGTARANKDFLMELAGRWDGLVVSVGYRLAPAHKYPVGMNDVFESIRHIVYSEEFEFDRGKIFIGGESAGGILSALSANFVREELPDIKLAGVYLNCGVLSLDEEKSKKSKYLNGYFLDEKLLRFFEKAYVHDVSLWKTDRLLTYNLPLKGLPPFLFHIAEMDVLGEQALDQVKQIQAENGEDMVQFKVFKEIPHGFCSLYPLFKDENKEAIDDLTRWMNSLLNN